jgi:hypothetical protein
MIMVSAVLVMVWAVLVLLHYQPLLRGELQPSAVVNLKTAKALGIRIPESVLLPADEAIK